MRHGFLPKALIGLLATACAVRPAPEVPMPAAAQVLPADARALRYGATAPDVFGNPQLRDSLQRLFGADWTPGPGRAFGAPAFFPSSSSFRMVRIGDREYIAITGCVSIACVSHGGILLIGADAELLARLDDGGFSHYYDYGVGATGGSRARTTLDGAWLAVQDVERG